MFRQYRAPIDRLARDQRGVSAVMVGLMAPVLVGGIGLAVDVGLWFTAAQSAQRAADAGAMAAAQSYSAGVTATSKLTDAARAAARQNGAVPANVSLRMLASGDEMEVTVTDVAPSFFAKLLYDGPINVQGRATATAGMQLVAPCVIGMDRYPHGGAGIRMDSGSVPPAQTLIDADDCAVHSNAVHKTSPSDGWGAIGVYSGSIRAALVTTVGTAWVASSSVASITPRPRNEAPLVSIAYAITVDASTMPVRPTDYSAGSHTLSPGRYPGGLTVRNGASVGFNPGIYVIEGDFKLFPGAALRNSSDVTFVVRNGKVQWETNGTVTLTSPATGATAGVLIMQEYTSGPCPWQVWNEINGGLKLRNSGVFFFRSCPFRMDNAELETVPNTFTQVLAPWIHINGGAKLDIEWTNPIGVAASLRGGGTAPRLRPNET